ncbi:hypothetical protein PERCYII29_5853 [Pseudomonas aeruginosa]|nr:hypothetical protein PERCYII29_5853 [Pseudomonas aeruginosa]
MCYGAGHFDGHLAPPHPGWRADLSPVQARLATGQGLFLSGGSATVPHRQPKLLAIQVLQAASGVAGERAVELA